MEEPLVYKSINIKQFALVPGICYLCHGTTEATAILCADCNADLPGIGTACARCGVPLKHGLVCRSCHTRPFAVDRTIAPFSYRYPLNRLVRQLKYHQQTILAKALGQALARKISKVCTSLPECILPLPLHRNRHMLRGFNQAVEIADVVGQAFSIPVDNRLLSRTINTRPQVGLAPAARQRNIKNAFKVTAGPAYEFVAIVDDVITTGATVNEAARVLKLSGIKRVEAWACARADSASSMA